MTHASTIGARIALLLIALSGQSLAQGEGSIEWATDTNGCQVWGKTPASNNTSATWHGKCSNGKAEGPGKIEWFANGALWYSVDGTMRGGRLNGPFLLTWAYGNRFEGTFRNGHISGPGTLIEKDGKRTDYNDGREKIGDESYAFVGDDGTTGAEDSPKPVDADNGSDAGGGGTSSTLALLGAAAKSVATAGGRNAAQFQALGSALQAAGGTSSSSSDDTSPVSAGQAQYSSNNMNKNIRYEPAVNDCVGLIKTSPNRPTLVNKCSFAVQHTYCVVATGTGAGSLSGNLVACQNHQIQTQYLNAGERLTVDTGAFTEAHSITCRYPAMTAGAEWGGSDGITWNGNRFDSPCIVITH